MSQDATNSFSKMNLNPSASEWKPNFGAKSFVPSFGAPAAAAAPAPAPVAPVAPAAIPGKIQHYSIFMRVLSRFFCNYFAFLLFSFVVMVTKL